MKSRQGFVGNSSSSSFIIKNSILKWGRVGYYYEKILTEQNEKDLIAYGFKKQDPSWDEKDYEYTLSICCNQGCVMKYLIEHKIPFEAKCHYGHEHYFWNGKDKNLIHLNNFGESFSMYSSLLKEVEEIFKQKAGEYVPTSVMANCKCDCMDGCTRQMGD